MSDPDGILEDLRGAGAADSEGRFTLDPAQALEKLRHFSLPDPERYVVHLVEAAVLSGARQIDFQRTFAGLEMEHDGASLGRVDLEQLLPGFLAGRWSTEDRLHPLALAINAALGGPAREVALESAARGTTVRARFRRDSVEVRAAEEASPARTHLRIRRARFRGPLGYLTGEPELSRLRAECSYGPAELRIHGQSLERPIPVPPAMEITVLKGKGIDLPFRGVNLGGQWDGESPGDFSAVVGLGWKTSLPRVRVRAAGRLLPAEGADPGPGVWALLAARSLPTDLVRNGLLRDRRLDEVIQVFREAAGFLRGRLVQRFEAMNAQHQGLAAPHLFVECRARAARGDYAGAAEAAGRLSGFWVGRADGRAAGALYREAVLLHAAGRTGEALARARLVVETRAKLKLLQVAESSDPVGGPLTPFRLVGDAAAVAEMHAWMVAVEADYLGGPFASVVSQRRSWLRDFCAKNSLPPPESYRFSREELAVEPDPGSTAAPFW